MIRLLSILAVGCLLVTAAMGCKAQGQVGETATQVTAPR